MIHQQARACSELFCLFPGDFVRTAVYVRLEDPRHALLVRYARAHGFTLNEVVERLVDQLLVQVAPAEFAPPAWLVQAVREGHIPLVLPRWTEVPDDGCPVHSVPDQCGSW
jgi:hypothetical protein